MANVFRGDRLSREINEELEAHIADAIDQGRDPAEARRAFGRSLHHREESHDLRLIPWLDSLRADAVFGWRQLKKNKVTSTAAILSLALSIGSCAAAFRLIDALLLRPLPVAHPERLYSFSRQGTSFDGKPGAWDSWSYPEFRLMRDAAKDAAEVLAISIAERRDITFGSGQEMEKAHVQYVSGRMFQTFGLQPVLGRLLNENDDLKPGAHPYAVISYDYWSSRFRRDPKVLGRTFRMDNENNDSTHIYEIVGVSPEPFTGTETGMFTAIFVSTMMKPGVNRPDAGWIRIFASVKPQAFMEPLRQKMNAINRAFEGDRAKGFNNMSKQKAQQYLEQSVLIEPAAAGVSNLQQDYRRSLLALGALVGLVLLIACANVANLMTAQASARAREMALRVSIGAGRWRLVQLVLVESAWVAFLAAAIGAIFAWWSAPFVVNMINPPRNPARLVLPMDWRLLAFALALTLAVTFLFGLAPALRASAVKPASALKGGEDPHSRRRLMHVLIAVQVAFCFLVLFVAGLFVTTFQRLSNQPTGFSAERILNLDSVSQRAEPPALWEQVAQHLRTLPGVETVAMAGWPLLSGTGSNSFLSIDGGPPTDVLAFFLSVTPGWIDLMKIPMVAGRDFRQEDTNPGAAIVNETFVKQYFAGESPLGRPFEKSFGHQTYRIVGVVRDARYRSIRETPLPVAYVPFNAVEAKGPAPRNNATFIVRTISANPLALALSLRQEVPKARSEFRVSNIRTQLELNESQTIRERLLAMLALFFGVVALLLAGIGLYGVLDYSVLQRRREIGIRMAIGAQAVRIAQLVTVEVFIMVLAGACAGVVLGITSVRYIETLFYQVKAGDLGMLTIPAVAILGVALLAALPAVIHAVRIDPAKMLRSE